MRKQSYVLYFMLFTACIIVTDCYSLLGSADNKNIPIYLFSTFNSISGSLCTIWDCIKTDVPGNDFQTCSMWKCILFDKDICVKWDCLATDMPHNDYNTCNIWECREKRYNQCILWVCVDDDIPTPSDDKTCIKYICSEYDKNNLCIRWKCSNSRNKKASDYIACSRRTCFGKGCNIWRCTETDIPGNDFETCDTWNCTNYDTLCREWLCIADDIPGIDTQSCDIYKCLKTVNINSGDTVCETDRDCGKNQCCIEGRCLDKKDLDGDSGKDICLCLGKTYINGKCCGDDINETWCSYSGMCKNGIFIRDTPDNNTEICELCYNGISVVVDGKNICCNPGDKEDNYCLADGKRCLMGYLHEGCGDGFICLNGLCIEKINNSLYLPATPKTVKAESMDMMKSNSSSREKNRKTDRITVSTKILPKITNNTDVSDNKSTNIDFKKFVIVILSINLIVIFIVEYYRHQKKRVFSEFKEELGILNDFLEKKGFTDNFRFDYVPLLGKTDIKKVNLILKNLKSIKDSYPSYKLKLPEKILLRLGLFYYYAGELEHSLKLLEKVLESDKTQPKTVLITLANIYSTLAWKNMEELRKNLGTHEFHITDKIKRYLKKEADILKILISDSPSPNIITRIGTNLYYLGEYREARKYFELALKNQPQNLSIINYLADICEKLGDNTDKIKYLKLGNRLRKKYHRQFYYGR